MLPTQLLSQTLNTSISHACMQEVDTTSVQASILLNVLREEGGNRPGVSQVVWRGGGTGEGMYRGAPS